MTTVADRRDDEPHAVGRPGRGAGKRLVTGFGATLLLTRLAVFATVLGLWQYYAGGPKSFLPADAVSRPSDIAGAFGHLFADGQILTALGTTSLSVVEAMAIAIPIGVLLAVATVVPVGRWILEPIVTITYAVPKVGLITLLVLVLGPTGSTHVTLVVTVIVFTYFYSVRQALNSIDRRRLDALRMLGASRLKIFWSFIAPSALPEFLAATRVSLPLAFAIEIYAELRVPLTNGLGTLLANFTENLNSASAMAVLVLVAILAYLLDVVVGGALTRRTTSIGLGTRR